MDNRFDKVSYGLVRRRAKAVTDGLRKYGSACGEEALEAADLIEHLLKKQEYLNIEQWIGGYFMGYEYVRQHRGWNPMLWLKAWRAKRPGFAQLRRVNFGNREYERIQTDDEYSMELDQGHPLHAGRDRHRERDVPADRRVCRVRLGVPQIGKRSMRHGEKPE